FGILPTTEPDLYGPAHNPWRQGYSTGGSSGGAAAAVAAGIAPIAHAGDGGGSIRIPASCCGVFGFKPSRGMTPNGPHMSENLHGFAIQHVVTRTVRDSAVMLDATHGPETVSPYFGPTVTTPFATEIRTAPGPLRIAVWTDPLVNAKPADPEVVAAIRQTAKLLESLGHHVTEAKPTYDQDLFSYSFFRLFCCAAAGEVLNTQRMLGRDLTRDDVELTTWMGALFGKAMTGGEFSLALRDLQTVMRDWARFLTDYDVLLTPVTARPPPKHGALTPPRAERLVMETIARANAARIVKIPGVIDRIVSKAYDYSPYTMFGNAGGLPSMSVPLSMSREGLPIGSLFTSRLGRDGLLFQLAAQLEEAQPWIQKRAPRFGLS
ncbi:MAG: amidase, partial [Proteobacteria bacterium]